MDIVMSILDTVRSLVANAGSVASTNLSIGLVIKLMLAYFFIIWAAFIIWVIKDITNRSTNIFVQALSIFLIIFFTPLFGLPIYLLIRPRQTIFEQYYEEGEFEEEDREHLHHCDSCGYPVEADYHYCPKCRYELVRECHACHRTMRSDWFACPYCGVENTGTTVNQDTEEITTEVVIEKKEKKKSSKKSETEAGEVVEEQDDPLKSLDA